MTLILTRGNWEEVIAADISEFLSIPHASYHLGKVRGSTA